MINLPDMPTRLNATPRFAAALGFSVVSLVMAWLTRDLLIPAFLPCTGILFYAALYAGLALLAHRMVSALYVGFEHIAAVTAYLCFGPVSAAAVIFLGCATYEVLRLALGDRLALPREPIRQALSRYLMSAAVTSFSVVVAGWIFVHLGGDLPLRTVTLAAFPQIFAFTAVHAVLFAVPVTLYVGLFIPRANRQTLLRMLWGLSLLVLCSTPMAFLIAAAHNSAQPGIFLLLLGSMILGASLFRLAEQTQSALNRRIEELATLNSVGQALSANLSTSEVLQSIYEQVTRLIDAPMFYVALYEPETETVHFPFYIRDYQRIEASSIQRGNGITEHIIRTGKPLLLCGDIDAYLKRMGIEKRGRDAVCYLGVPLIADQQVIGVLSVQSHINPKAYDKATLELLTTVAAQASVALRNASLYQNIYEMADRLALLNNVSSVVTATLDLDQVLKTVCTVVTEVGYADKAGIFLADESGNTLRLAYSIGLSDDYVAQFQEIVRGDEDSASGGPLHVLHQREMMAIPDVHADTRGRGWRTLAEIEGYVGLLTVPLIANQQVIGFLAAYYAQAHQFSAGELDLMRTLTNQVAVAVANARLYDDTQARAREMARLVAASRAFTATLDLPGVADRVFDELASLLKPDRITLRLIEPDGSLKLMAHRNSPDAPLLMRPDGTLLRALNERKALRLPQNEEDAAKLRAVNLQNVYVFPLVSSDKTFGLIMIGHEKPRWLSSRERQFVEAMVNQASTAIRNAQLFGQIDAALDERVTELSAIEAISRKISASLDLDSIVAEVLDTALTVTSADVAHFGMADMQTGQITFVQRTRESTALSVSESHIAQGVVGRVLRTGAAARIDDVLTDEDYIPPAGLSGLRSELCVPIIQNSQNVGVLNLESAHPNMFTTNHERFLTTLADHAAIALENAQLFKEVRAARDRMQVIFDSARDGMLLIDANGDLALANRAAERLLDYPLHAVQGKSLLDVADLAYWTEQIRELVLKVGEQSERVTRRTIKLHAPRATRDIEETSIPVLDNEGRTAGRLLVLRDVSEEEALKLFRKEVSDMLIHDLRSPLTGVISSLNLLKDLVEAREYEDLLQVIDVALSSSQTQMKMIESLLDIAKLETGRMPLNLSVHSISLIVDNAMAALNLVAGEARVRIINHIPADFPLLHIDESQINRVVFNLLDNALRHTPSGGEIRVAASLAAPTNASGPPRPAMARLSVTDTGKGIPLEARERVFEKFVQLPRSAVRGHRGSGLGLTFCKLTVEAHGGEIWVESGPEGGAAFVFTLPIAPAPSSDSAQDKVQEYHQDGR